MRQRRAGQIDRHIGARIRDARLRLRLPQTELAALVGISYQQLQKYERGINRVSHAMLLRLASHLKLPPHAFSEGLTTADEAEIHDESRRRRLDYAESPEGERLLDSILQLPPDLRRSTLQLVREMAGALTALEVAPMR